MKSNSKHLALIMALLMCLSLAACGDGGGSDDDYRAPAVIEDAAYDSAASYDSSYNEYLGIWAASDSDVCDALEVEAIDSGLYFTLYKGYDIVAAGNAQNVPEYAYIYFFNENDGKAYQVSGGTDGMTLESFGTFVMDTPATRTDGYFADIANTWCLNGSPYSTSYISIDENGEWELFEGEGDGTFKMTDYGYIEQDPGIEEQYYAHSRQYSDVTYDINMSFEKEAFSWGDDGDSYIRLDLCETE